MKTNIVTAVMPDGTHRCLLISRTADAVIELFQTLRTNGGKWQDPETGEPVQLGQASSFIRPVTTKRSKFSDAGVVSTEPAATAPQTSAVPAMKKAATAPKKAAEVTAPAEPVGRAPVTTSPAGAEGWASAPPMPAVPAGDPPAAQQVQEERFDA